MVVEERVTFLKEEKWQSFLLSTNDSTTESVYVISVRKNTDTSVKSLFVKGLIKR